MSSFHLLYLFFPSLTEELKDSLSCDKAHVVSNLTKKLTTSEKRILKTRWADEPWRQTLCGTTQKPQEDFLHDLHPDSNINTGVKIKEFVEK